MIFRFLFGFSEAPGQVGTQEDERTLVKTDRQVNRLD